MWSYNEEKQNAIDLDAPIARRKNLSGKFLHAKSDVYYLQNGKYHREDGPAIILSNRQMEWWLNDYNYSFYVNKDIPIKHQWIFVKGNINNIEIIGNPTIEIQKYVLKRNPYLINKIQNIDPEIKQQFSDITTIKNLGI